MLFIVPMSVGMVFLIKPIVYIVPNYLKWEPALYSFYLFVLASAVAGVSTPLLNALNAIGKIKISLYFMVFWTVFMWITAPILVIFIGFNGVAVAAAFMSLTTVAVVILSKRFVAFSLAREIMPALSASAVMGVAMLIALPYFSQNFISLLVYVVISGIVYITALLLFFRIKVMEELQYIVSIVRS